MFKQHNTWYTDFIDSNGKRIRVSTHETEKKKAQAFQDKLSQSFTSDRETKALYEVTKNRLITSDITFNEAFKAFELYPRGVDSEKQLNVHNNYWNDFAAFAESNGVKTVNQVNQELAFAYINRLKTEGRFTRNSYRIKRKSKRRSIEINCKRTNRKLSTRTINCYITTLKLVFRILKKTNKVIDNPFEDVVKMRNKQVDREAYTLDEIKAIIDRTEGTYLYPIVIIGITTGLSLKDICLLQWTNIRNGFIVKERCKTGTRLEIPILPKLHELLEEEFKHKTSEYIFPELQDLYTNASFKISTDFKDVLNECGIENTKKLPNRSRASSVKDIHSLRHTFAYIAGINQIPMSVVQSVLGHTTPKMTSLYMAHVTHMDKIKSLERLQLPFDTKPKKDKKEQFRRILSRLTPSQFLRFRTVLLRHA